jgi:FdhD protein
MTMGRITTRRKVVRHQPGRPAIRVEDTLAVEEPLDIRVGGAPFTLTMRTPGHDVELAIGFLLSEGVITSDEDVAAGQFCAGAAEDGVNTYNVLDITLTPGVPPPSAALSRNFFMSSSCGLCGKASIDAVQTFSHHPVADDPVELTAEEITELPDRLRAEQRVFDKTGGLHAAGLFDARTGKLLVVREDVGRHNAVDKVVGWAASQGRIPAASTVLMLSGRAGFELVQKASMAGIPVVAAVSAPSSLAVEMADQAGMTLCGFVRGASLVVYAGAERVVEGAPARVS